MWKVQNKEVNVHDIVLGYRLIETDGRTMDISTLELLYGMRNNNIKVDGLTIGQIYTDMGNMWKLIARAEKCYIIINIRTLRTRNLSKSLLISNIESGDIMVENCHVRTNNDGTKSIVCKDQYVIINRDSANSSSNPL